MIAYAIFDYDIYGSVLVSLIILMWQVTICLLNKVYLLTFLQTRRYYIVVYQTSWTL